MYFIEMLLSCFMLLLLHSSAEKVSVDLTYASSSSSADQMEFDTEDTDICSKFNAKYISKSCCSLLNTVTCKCRNGSQSFFGLNGEKLTCKDESSNLYGCSKSYALSLPQNKYSTIPKQTFYNTQCDSPSFNVYMWNGQKFVLTTYSKDFNVKVTTSTDTQVVLEWKNSFPNFTPYKGRLIQVVVRCGFGNYKSTLCFTLKGAGTYKLYTEMSEPSGSQSIPKVLIIILGIIAGLFILGFLSACCSKEKESRKRKKSSVAQAVKVGEMAFTAIGYVIEHMKG